MFEFLDFTQIEALTNAVFEAENEEIFMIRWIVEGHSRQMGFEEFKKMLIKPSNDKKSAEEILNSVEKMMNSTHWEGFFNGNI